MQAQSVDFTSCFRALSASLRGDGTPPAAFTAWTRALARPARGRSRAIRQPRAETMDRVNPVYVPRNHLVEDALTAATEGDLEPFERLVDVLADPFTERPGLEAYAAPAPVSFGACYQTFCGT